MDSGREKWVYIIRYSTQIPLSYVWITEFNFKPRMPLLVLFGGKLIFGEITVLNLTVQRSTRSLKRACGKVVWENIH